MASGDSAERTIRDVVRALEAAGVPYMVTGSFASALHGAPRTTQDLDRWIVQLALIKEWDKARMWAGLEE